MKKQRIPRTAVWLAWFATPLVIGTVVLAAPFDQVPHEFKSADPLSASQMNENFAALTADLNALQGDVAGVTAANVALTDQVTALTDRVADLEALSEIGVCGKLGVPCPEGFACAAPGYCSNVATGEVWVPAGTFWMGCNSALDDLCMANELAQHEVTLSAYAIDQSEVTAAEYKACVTGGHCSAAGTGANATYDVAGKETHPINYVNWNQATAFCAWPGKASGVQRLCTEAEWERAARGGCETVSGDCQTSMRTYPWGEAAPSASLANFAGVAGYIVRQGGFSPFGDSPYGARDMAGNVWEWVDDWYADSYLETAVTDPTGPGSGSNRVERGGGFGSGAVSLRASRRDDVPPGITDDWGLGLRCCRTLP